MTILNNTAPAEPATITKRKLFSQFLDGKIFTFSRKGVIVEARDTYEYLSGFDTEFLDEALTQGAKKAAENDDPSDDLIFLAAEFQAAANQVRYVERKFCALMLEQSVETPDDVEPRFHPMCVPPVAFL